MVPNMCWISLSARAHAFKENNFSLENLRAILWDANHEYKISYSIKLTVLPCFIFDLQINDASVQLHQCSPLRRAVIDRASTSSWNHLPKFDWLKCLHWRHPFSSFLPVLESLCNSSSRYTEERWQNESLFFKLSTWKREDELIEHNKQKIRFSQLQSVVVHLLLLLLLWGKIIIEMN